LGWVKTVAYTEKNVMKKVWILHILLLVGNVCIGLGMLDKPMLLASQACRDYGDNPPGVTVYLETTPMDTTPAATSDPTKQQWTAVSFKEAGRAPDGSPQAVLSIQKATVDKDFEPIDLPIKPVKAHSRWQ
jgi:hypothetical protein